MFKEHPVYKVDYDDECLELCIPNSQHITNARYREIVRDTDSVEQIARIMIRYNSLPIDLMDMFTFVLPRIDAWDFAQLRDGKVELRHLRCKVIGIHPD